MQERERIEVFSQNREILLTIDPRGLATIASAKFRTRTGIYLSGTIVSTAVSDDGERVAYIAATLMFDWVHVMVRQPGDRYIQKTGKRIMRGKGISVAWDEQSSIPCLCVMTNEGILSLVYDGEWKWREAAPVADPPAIFVTAQS